MKFWGLLGRVATIACTIEQFFLIVPNLRFFIGQDVVIDISTNMCLLSTKFLPWTILSHTYPMKISHFLHESSNIQYQGYSTMGKMTTQNEMDAGSGIM